MASEFDEKLEGMYAEYDEYVGEDPGDYRILGFLAIGSLVLGVLTPLVFFSPWFFPLPLAALVLGGLALYRIYAAPEELTGKPFAIAGIACAATFWTLGSGWNVYCYYTMAPPGYEPIPYGLLQADPETNDVPQAARDLEGRKVFLRGYMYPGRQQFGLTEFVLCRDNGVCQFCSPSPAPTDLVHVRLVDGLKIDFTTRLVSVGGTLSLTKGQSVQGHEDVAYFMEVDCLR